MGRSLREEPAVDEFAHPWLGVIMRPTTVFMMYRRTANSRLPHDVPFALHGTVGHTLLEHIKNKLESGSGQNIARRTLLQSLTVRPVLDDDGSESGMFEMPAVGRRYRALELLVREKRLARTAPIPCVIRTEGLAEEDSLAENVQRAPLHPLDQFRAFRDLREKGMSEEEIAAVFFVSIQVVKQRLKLASISPRLLDLYAEDSMTLDQLMAFKKTRDSFVRANLRSFASAGFALSTWLDGWGRLTGPMDLPS